MLNFTSATISTPSFELSSLLVVSYMVLLSVFNSCCRVDKAGESFLDLCIVVMDHSNSSEECMVNAGQQAMALREGNPDGNKQHQPHLPLFK